jgi:ribose transport system ATP-binding protein
MDETVALRRVSKTFNDVKVLHDVDIVLKPGQVHALVGENGSGKSTIVKILAGFHVPDQGSEMIAYGQPVTLPMKPGRPLQLGLTFVHQDLGVVESASVLDNVLVGRYETGRLWRIPPRHSAATVRRALARLGISVDPSTLLSDLDAVDRALVAIARALDQLGAQKGGVLVLDEASQHLPRDGVDRLFAAVRTLAASGYAVLFVSHRLEEVLQLSDVVTILRDGRVVAHASTDTLTEDEIITYMLGMQMKEPSPETSQKKSAAVALLASDVGDGQVSEFSLELSAGEIVGVTGLMGMGWSRIPYLLFGAIHRATGGLVIGGVSYRVAELSPRRSIAAGMALIPGDRAHDGAFLGGSLKENVTLVTLGRYFRRGIIRSRREYDRSAQLLRAFDVRPPEPARIMSTLSGGNQQKAVAAKWLEVSPKVLLLHEPTQGVDVGARAEIHQRLGEVASTGVAIVVASSAFDDLAQICDRVLVFRDGRVSDELAQPMTTEDIASSALREADRSRSGRSTINVTPDDGFRAGSAGVSEI